MPFRTDSLFKCKPWLTLSELMDEGNGGVTAPSKQEVTDNKMGVVRGIRHVPGILLMEACKLEVPVMVTCQFY